MIKIKPDYDKLKTSLRLASHRLQILQAKKSEICEKLKMEVADNMKNGKFMKARIQAQRIAREEATVEAMDLLEMYCNQILERYELFQEKKLPDVSLLSPVASLIWVAPYFQSSVEELKGISKQMASKYGSRFCRQALTNNCGIVRRDLVERVEQFMPSDENTENCLRKICSKYGIDYRLKSKDVEQEIISKQDNTFSSNAVKSGDVQCVAEGSNKIDDPVTSKKALKKIMNKFKSKNKNEKSENRSDVSRDVNLQEILTEDLGGGKAKNNPEGKKYSQNWKDNKVSGIEVENNNISCKYNEMIAETYDLPFKTSSIHSEAVGTIYPDPPPPYNCQYLTDNETEEELKVQRTLDKDFQPPTCPDDDPN